MKEIKSKEKGIREEKRKMINLHRLTVLYAISLMLTLILGAPVLIPSTYAQQIGAPIVIAEAPSGSITIFDQLGQTIGGPSIPRIFDSDVNGGQDALAVGDVDGDGRDDIVIAEAPSGSITIFNQLGQTIGGPFLTTFDSDVGGRDALAVGDVDGDGRDDIVIAEAPSGSITFINRFGVQTICGQCPKIFDSDVNSGQDALAVGDVDGDGRDDIVIAEAPSGVITTFNRLGQRIGAPFNTPFDSDVNSGQDALVVGDVDGDGRDDIVIAEAPSGSITICNPLGRTCGMSFQSTFDSDVNSGQDALAVGTVNETDSDGDGLLDNWESFGFDGNGDGFNSSDPNDVDLPGFGADPMHKDLFLELDWMTGQQPNQAAIRAMKGAFALAPIDAGGVPNPDGTPGINLWVDTGGLTDTNGNEDGAGVGTCGDGMDNGGMDGADANDTDCLVGDNLGGGNAFPAFNICHVDNPNFYMVKNRNGNEDGAGVGTCGDGMDNGGMDGADANDPDCQGFNPARRFIFRYAISGISCGDSGGWGEIGGNDFIEYNHDGGTIMHELGHNLNLRHGGNVNANCKPNYVSVMNYDNQFGINQIFPAGGGTIIDYSPPRFGSEDGAGLRTCEDGIDNGGVDGLIDAADPDCLGRSVAPLPQLIENNLDETTILNSTDPINQFIFKNPGRQRIQWPLNGGDRDGDGIPDGVDWNGDGRPPLREDGFGLGTCGDGVDNGGMDGLADAADPDCMPSRMLIVNIDTSANVAPVGTPPNFRPAACTNNSTNSTLIGFDDWTNISIPFRQFGDSGDSAINPVTEPEPILEDLIQMQQAVNTTDLSITKVSDPDTVEVGADFKYILTVTNKGPNPSGSVEVQDALPAEVSYKSDNAGCVKVPSDEEVLADTLICDLGALLSGEQRQIEIIIGTVGANEGSITNTATVENVVEFAGSDPEPSDNFATVTTTITPVRCGNGTVGSGEDCDDGNTLDGDCCSSTCQFESSGSECGDAGDDCTNQDTCDGAGTCTDNGFKPNGTFCSDGNNCTRTDTCQSGICAGGNPLICGGLPASICGTSGNDNLIGTSLADVIHGTGGADTINGLGDNDIICGGNGNDTINGNNGNDRLLGQKGNDILRGNKGNDRMNGNGGNDSCDGGLPSNPNTGDTAENCETVINVP